jgi:DNA relaxase NicK
MNNSTLETPGAQGTVIEAQCDWVTAGWEEGPAADRAEAWIFGMQAREAREGARATPFRLMGFEGSAVGRVRSGRRADTLLLQLSGDLAERHLGTVAERADRISRIDLAVTVRLDPCDPFLGETTYAQATNWREEHPAAAMPWIVQDGDGGCTAYVGHRASDRFLRVYNKEAECKAAGDAAQAGHYRACWRYELESKGSAAISLARAAAAASDRARYVRQYLHKYTTQHGIEPRFDIDGSSVLVPGFRRRSDAESRLAWIRRSVNPAIVSLLEVKDRGDILEALGLAETSPTDR